MRTATLFYSGGSPLWSDEHAFLEAFQPPGSNTRPRSLPRSHDRQACFDGAHGTGQHAALDKQPWPQMPPALLTCGSELHSATSH